MIGVVVWYITLKIIVYKDIFDLNVCTGEIETLWIEIDLPQTKPILLGNVYRPPDTKADDLCKLDSLFQNLTSVYKDVIILGDW